MTPEEMNLPDLSYSVITPFQGRTYKILVRRAGRLGITPDEVNACKSLDDLKQLARKKFLSLSKKYHPDHRKLQGRGLDRRSPKALNFQECRNTYEWFQDMTQAQFDRAVRARVTVADEVIPLDWAGWEEYDHYYAGFQIVRYR